MFASPCHHVCSRLFDVFLVSVIYAFGIPSNFVIRWWREVRVSVDSHRYQASNASLCKWIDVEWFGSTMPKQLLMTMVQQAVCYIFSRRVTNQLQSMKVWVFSFQHQYRSMQLITHTYMFHFAFSLMQAIHDHVNLIIFIRQTFVVHNFWSNNFKPSTPSINVANST